MIAVSFQFQDDANTMNDITTVKNINIPVTNSTVMAASLADSTDSNNWGLRLFFIAVYPFVIVVRPFVWTFGYMTSGYKKRYTDILKRIRVSLELLYRKTAYFLK
jgi:hypothetical protein